MILPRIHSLHFPFRESIRLLHFTSIRPISPPSESQWGQAEFLDNYKLGLTPRAALNAAFAYLAEMLTAMPLRCFFPTSAAHPEAIAWMPAPCNDSNSCPFCFRTLITLVRGRLPASYETGEYR